MSEKPREGKEISKPKTSIILGEDDYNNYNGIYTCVECGMDFLGKEDSFLCIHCLNNIHGEC